MARADKIKAALRRKPKQAPVTADRLLSSGGTLLNLACSGDAVGGFLMGTYVFLVGDTASGKTFLSLTCLAEASINPLFDGYRFIYDNSENGALMDFAKFFGQAVADRVEPPGTDAYGQPVYSQTVEEFYYHVDDALQKDKPFIYILDSQDALSSAPEVDKFAERKKAYRKGKDTTGSYGDAKAKVHSGNIRRLMGPLRDTGSILIVLNQTRDSFDMFNPKSYSGGRALLFYATLQLWSSVAGRIERTVRGKKRQLGVDVKIKVKKNRLTGREQTITIPILWSSGIDDVGSCCNYLISEEVWEKSKDGTVTVNGMGPTWRAKNLEQVVRRIEAEGMEQDLRELVALTWREIDDACVAKRKRRYE